MQPVLTNRCRKKTSVFETMTNLFKKKIIIIIISSRTKAPLLFHSPSTHFYTTKEHLWQEGKKNERAHNCKSRSFELRNETNPIVMGFFLTKL